LVTSASVPSFAPAGVQHAGEDGKHNSSNQDTAHAHVCNSFRRRIGAPGAKTSVIRMLMIREAIRQAAAALSGNPLRASLRRPRHCVACDIVLVVSALDVWPATRGSRTRGPSQRIVLIAQVASQEACHDANCRNSFSATRPFGFRAEIPRGAMPTAGDVRPQRADRADVMAGSRKFENAS